MGHDFPAGKAAGTFRWLPLSSAAVNNNRKIIIYIRKYLYISDLLRLQMIVWILSPCSLLDGHHWLRRTCCLHVQVRAHNPEDHSLHTQSNDHFRFSIIILLNSHTQNHLPVKSSQLSTRHWNNATI
jgi:hypothetical protein